MKTFLIMIYFIGYPISCILLVGCLYSFYQKNWPLAADNDKKLDMIMSILISFSTSFIWPVFVPMIYSVTNHFKHGWFSRDIKFRRIKNE